MKEIEARALAVGERVFVSFAARPSRRIREGALYGTVTRLSERAFCISWDDAETGWFQYRDTKWIHKQE